MCRMDRNEFVRSVVKGALSSGGIDDIDKVRDYSRYIYESFKREGYENILNKNIANVVGKAYVIANQSIGSWAADAFDYF